MGYYEEVFLKRLKEGQIYEKIALKLICGINKTELHKFKKNYKYDFQTIDGVKYEVKSDKMALITNNFFIEFSGYGKPSGIEISHSNFYILTDTINYFLIETDKLKLLCNECGIVKKVKINNTYGYLLKRGVIIENSKKIN